jgi:HEPN domain-containing protein
LTNRERANKLLCEAEEIYRSVPEDLKRGSFNIVVRRSQEVLEIVLKGLLCELGVDYPKSHDVAPLFSEIARKKGLEIKEGFLKWLEKTSADLASKRAPAFYAEEDYGYEDAKEAKESAEKVLTFGKELMEKLRK